MLPSCYAHDAVEALKLELEDAAAEGGETVIPASLVVVASAFRRHFFDQGSTEHPLYRSVERTGPIRIEPDVVSSTSPAMA
jgi:hypothetical protein